ncbi:unnamed protein product [Sphagnum jensenii]
MDGNREESDVEIQIVDDTAPCRRDSSSPTVSTSVYDDDDACRIGSPPEVGPRFCQHSGALLEEGGDIITFCVSRFFRGSLGMYLNGVLAATGCEGATFFPRKSVAETSFRSNKPLRATTVPDGEKRSEEE